MNLKIKIDKYGNLVNLDTGTIILASNELFTDNFWETDGTTWKVNTTTQVTASATADMPIVVPIGEFTQGSRVDFYFRLHLPILDYNKRVNIFEFSTGTNVSNDISFCKLANSNGYDLLVSGSRQQLHIASTESLDIVGVLTMYNIGSNTIAVFITLYSNEDGTLTKLLEYAYRGGSGNRLYFGVSRDYHTNLSSYMVEGIAFDEDIINPISAVTKYLNDTGLSEVWTNTKNYVSAQLLGKSDVGHTHSASDITSGLSTVATSGSYNDLTNKPTIPTVNNGTLTIQQNGTTVKTFTANASSNVTANITVPTKTSDLTNDSGFLTSHQDLSGYIPRSGGAVISGDLLGKTNNTSRLIICGGTNVNNGGSVSVYGKDSSSTGDVTIQSSDGTNMHQLRINSNGTLAWDGQSIQTTSDQRLKQQIAEIDDKLLDAWEDVEPVQFKYNDAVEQKSDNARLHTGYVVQQIDSACKSHGVDISEYGLYCHEEYPEETEEVEVEQKDGTKIKETKVIREASEHYSLRYTEALIVECAYLRKCIKELRNEIEQLKSSK